MSIFVYVYDIQCRADYICMHVTVHSIEPLLMRILG